VLTMLQVNHQREWAYPHCAVYYIGLTNLTLGRTVIYHMSLRLQTT